MAEPSFGEVLEAMTGAMATNVRDWGADRMDAFLWGVLLGWDCDEQHDESQCEENAMASIAARHGWDARQVERVRSFRRAVERVASQPAPPEPCQAETRSWDHFTPEQADSYWIRCTLQGEHREHKDENTGLTWVGGL